MSSSMSYSKVMTRKATAQELETKLKRALEEIQDLRNDNNQLIQERNENEEECLRIINHNTQLKNELAELHAHLADIMDDRNQLLETVKKFDQCCGTYERTLGRIHELEVDLRDANKTIQQYEDDMRCQEVQHTQSLYEELLGSPAGHVAAATSYCKNNNINFNSKNKLRKYVKINNYIQKTEKLIKRQKCFHKNVLLRKQRTDLIDSLELYSIKLNESRFKYENETQLLQTDITRLHRSLEVMTDNYKSAQAQISEHILAANKFIQQCSCNSSAGPSDQQQIDVCQPLSLNSEDQSLPFTLPSTNSIKDNVLVFSDGMGVGYGCLLGNKLDCSVTNFCMPDAPLSRICKAVENCSYNDKSIIIIMMGNATNVNKRDILKSFSILSGLCVRKVILCAFPYMNNYTWDQNNSIHLLNTMIYNLTCHSDNIVFFDTNKFIDKLFLTGKKFCLPIRIKKEIAGLLVYNIK